MKDGNQAQTLASLALELQAARDTEPTADQVMLRAVELVPDADWVSLTVRSRGSFQTLAASSPAARKADEMQYAVGEGPCVEAAVEGGWFRSGDVEVDRRWPRWGPLAVTVGVRSLLSVQLATADDPLGALNLYSRRAEGFDEPDDVDFALLYAVHAAVALTTAREITGLTHALHSRHTIGVAQGVLMERFGLSVDASFNLLRRYSMHTNTRLADVAAVVVSTGNVPD